MGWTKELVTCSKNDFSTNPVVIKGQSVESADNCKYLGTIMDCKCNFSESTEYERKDICKAFIFWEDLTVLEWASQFYKLYKKAWLRAYLVIISFEPIIPSHTPTLPKYSLPLVLINESPIDLWSGSRPCFCVTRSVCNLTCLQDIFVSLARGKLTWMC